MSLTAQAENKVRTKERELERHRKKQADQEVIASKETTAAEKADAGARNAKSPGSAKTKRSEADRCRAKAARARQEAARASNAVAATTKELHAAQRALEKARGDDAKKARAKDDRTRRAAERKAEQEADRERRRAAQQERERQRDEDRRERELDALRERVAMQERRIAGAAPATVTVLMVSASPDGQAYLHIDREIHEVQRRLRTADYRDSLKLEVRPAARMADLIQMLNEVKPDVIHFSGHSNEAGIALENAEGTAQLMPSGQIAALLSTMTRNIRLIVFNSCDSAEHADQACSFLEAAIGMETSLHDNVAIVFAAQLYNSLAFGNSLRQAFEEAKLQVELEGLDIDHGRPQLYTAVDVDPLDVYLVAPVDDAA